MSQYKDIVALESQALEATKDRHFQEARRAHGRALDLAWKSSRPRLVAVIFSRLGQVLETQGEVQDAVIAYESGLKALAAKLDLEQALEKLALTGKTFDLSHIPIPDLYSAPVAQALEEAEGDPVLAVRLLISIGNAYLRQPQEEPALAAYQQALGRPEIEHAPLLRAYALANSGEIHRRRGELDAAGDALTEAVRLMDLHAGPLEKRRALALLAGIARDRDRADEAHDLYRRALVLYAQADDPLGEGRTLAGLGRLYLEQGRFAEAGDTYGQALGLARRSGDEETLWHTYWGLGTCQRAAGRLDEAISSLQESLSLVKRRRQELRTDEGKVTFLESVQDIFDQLIASLLDRAQQDPASYEDALAVVEEARGHALLDLMGGRGRRRPAAGQTVRPSRLRPFPEQFQSALQTAPGVPSLPGEAAPWVQTAPGVPTPPGEAPPWVQTAPGVPTDRTRLEPEPSRQPEAVTGGEPVQPAELPPLARLVFHVLVDQTAVWAVTPAGEVHGHVAPLGREALALRIGELRQALGAEEPRGVRLARDLRPIGAPALAEPEPLLRQLYRELIAPVADLLPDDGTPVVVEPHGALWLLPFAALLGPDDGWLADRWPLLYSPSAQVLDEIRQEPDYGGPADLTALIIGNPAMPAVPIQGGVEVQLEPLPGAEAEAMAIAALFPEERRTLLVGAEAHRAAVQEAMPQFGILHLATHGIAYDQDPLASFIALAEGEDGDGLLTARRVITLSLPADLIGLSACQTGLGQISGDGMIGLSRAFLVTGARAVLVSQWSVSDQATAELMTLFYRAYLALDNKALALQQAMASLRTRGEYAHPRFWAPFLVVGAEA